MMNSFSKGPDNQTNKTDPRPEDIDMLTKLSTDIASLSRLVREMKSRGEDTVEQEKKLLALESVYNKELTVARENAVKKNNAEQNEEFISDPFSGTLEGYANDKARKADDRYTEFRQREGDKSGGE